MQQRMYLTLLCLGLVGSGMACVPTRYGPTVPAGYFFTLLVTQPQIWVGPVDMATVERFPNTSELIVNVQNAQGQPVDGVPVAFEVEPAWARVASVSPTQATTRNGTARATFEAQTTGVAHIMVRVDNTVQRVTIRISNSNWSHPGTN